jgi:DNA-binding SARP family transcriptional activator
VQEVALWCFAPGFHFQSVLFLFWWLVRVLTHSVQRETIADREQIERSYDLIRQRSYPHVIQFDWFSSEDFRIRDYGRTLLQYLVKQAQNEGDFHAMLTYSHDLLQEDNCDEWAYEIAIRAYLGLAQWDEAERVYRTCSKVVQRELGVEPSERLRALLPTPS